MLYLIDGYNLLHAIGILTSSRALGPQGLERARQRLLDFLHGAHGQEAANVTVVFDAARVPSHVPHELNYQGIHVVFATEQDEADDLIELLIRQAATPRNLTIVSDDHRLQQAGRRRPCRVLGCGDYLDELERLRRPARPAPPAEPPDKPEGLSRQETQHWLDEFAGLEEEPEWKKLMDPPEFFKGE